MHNLWGELLYDPETGKPRPIELHGPRTPEKIWDRPPPVRVRAPPTPHKLLLAQPPHAHARVQWPQPEFATLPTTPREFHAKPYRHRPKGSSPEGLKGVG
jgi:hypothetical protein